MEQKAKISESPKTGLMIYPTVIQKDTLKKAAKEKGMSLSSYVILKALGEL